MFIENLIQQQEKAEIIYIEYQDNKVFSAITSDKKRQQIWDFETDCIDENSFMFFCSGSGLDEIIKLYPPKYKKGNVKFLNKRRKSWKKGLQKI